VIAPLALIGLLALHQTQETTAPRQSVAAGCQFDEVYNAGGWSIPGVPSPSTHLPVSSASPIEPGKVRREEVTPKQREVMVTYVECDRREAARLRLVTGPFRVLHVFRYSKGTRVFAYAVDLGVEEVDRGRRVLFGSAVSYYYYDPDGSGVFRVMRKWGIDPMIDPTPEWGKQKEVPLPLPFGYLIDSFEALEGMFVQAEVEIAKGANGACMASPGAGVGGCRTALAFSEHFQVPESQRLRELLEAGKVVPLVVRGRVVRDSRSSARPGSGFDLTFIIESVVEVGTPRNRKDPVGPIPGHH
jgi:hypothetical protein